jgi:hypothetical protein
VAKDNKIFKFKLAGETLKLTDNAANMGVDIARRPEIKGNIFSKIDNLLRTTTKADILPSMRNEAGVKKFLGEESASRYIDEVAKSMKKEGATVTMIEGTAGNEWKTTTDYVFKFGDDGKTIKIFDKAGNPKGELDRVAKINDKYVMVESKGGAYDNYKKDLKFDDIEENKIIPFKEIDSKPEFLLLVPKEQSVLEHDTIKNLVNGLEGENVHAAADTFTHSLDDFNAAVARILK